MLSCNRVASSTAVAAIFSVLPKALHALTFKVKLNVMQSRVSQLLIAAAARWLELKVLALNFGPIAPNALAGIDLARLISQHKVLVHFPPHLRAAADATAMAISTPLSLTPFHFTCPSSLTSALSFIAQH